MNNRFAASVFNTRKFYRIGALLTGLILMLILKKTTSLPFYITGFLFMVAGQTLRWISASYLWGNHVVTKLGADYCCVSGPYAYIRNPLYLGNFIVDIGICIALNVWYFYIIFFAEFFFLYSIIIPYEEKFLQDKFGDVYADYKSHIRRFIPGLNRYKGGERLTPNYKAGFMSELYLIIILILAYIIIYFLFVR